MCIDIQTSPSTKIKNATSPRHEPCKFIGCETKQLCFVVESCTCEVGVCLKPKRLICKYVYIAGLCCACLETNPCVVERLAH